MLQQWGLNVGRFFWTGYLLSGTVHSSLGYPFNMLFRHIGIRISCIEAVVFAGSLGLSPRICKTSSGSFTSFYMISSSLSPIIISLPILVWSGLRVRTWPSVIVNSVPLVSGYRTKCVSEPKISRCILGLCILFAFPTGE